MTVANRATGFGDGGRVTLASAARIALRSPALVLRGAGEVVRARVQLRSADLGRLVRVRGRLHVDNRGRLEIGEHAQLLSHYARSVIAIFPDGAVEIGARTVINYGFDIAATKLVRIGDDCLIGTHAIILDNDFHGVVDRRTRPDGRPVVIEDGVWLGNRVTVLPGVTIGRGAVVGAGAVVSTDIPSASIAAGNPARVVGRI